MCWGARETWIPERVEGPWLEVAVGGDCLCALDAEGALRCWAATPAEEVMAVPHGRFVSVDVGVIAPDACVARTAEGKVQTWGYVEHGWSKVLPGTFLHVAPRCGITTEHQIRCDPNVWTDGSEGGGYVPPPMLP